MDYPTVPRKYPRVDQPKRGWVVDYMINEGMAKSINQRRSDAGYATKTGNQARAGDVYPLMIVKVHSPIKSDEQFEDELQNAVRVFENVDEEVYRLRRFTSSGEGSVNGQLFLDGNDSYWITSAAYSADLREGRWSWPD